MTAIQSAPQDARDKRWSPALSTVAVSVLGLATYLPYPLDVGYSQIALSQRLAADEHYYGREGETSVTVRAAQADLDAIHESFVIRNASEVRRFIADRPELVSLIVEALSVIRDYFPESTAVLDLLADRESDRVGVEMSLQTSKTPNVALAMLERFDEDWWLANMTRAHSLLTVSLEYV
jgi:hypothetical protein